MTNKKRMKKAMLNVYEEKKHKFSREYLLAAVEVRELTGEEFNELAIYYIGLIKKLAYRSYLQSMREFEEIEAEGWLAFVRSVKEYRDKRKPGVTFTLYLWMRCRSHLAHIWRKEYAQFGRRGELNLRTLTAQSNTERDAILNITTAEVLNAIGTLSIQQRAVMFLTGIRDLSISQTAVVLRTTYNAVNIARKKGRKNLRRIVKTGRKEKYSVDGVQKTFITRDSHQVRALIDGEAILFIVKDVCRAMGMGERSSVTRMKRLFPELLDRKRLHILTKGGTTRTYEVATISESNLYRLVDRLDRPKAFEFQEWVTQEVLPSIRKRAKRFHQWM